MQTRFRLNGEVVTPKEVDATTTLLDWLRDTRGLTGTKEGCNEGDCGACSVMVTDEKGARVVNACILFIPQLNGKSVRTVEGIAAPDGTLHAVQQTVIDHHGSQCGFCTPGFVVAMATAHLNGATDHDVQLAGNLCRCTGYAPIVRAAEAAAAAPVPAHLREDILHLPERTFSGVATRGGGSQAPERARPMSTDELAAWYLAHPNGTLIAGATDVGLWVTKGFRELGPVAFLAGCAGLDVIDIGADRIKLGATSTITDVEAALAPLYPSLGAMLRRYGSVQVRNAATIGGNIANGSPIGDGSPALMALDATLHLRRGDRRRDMPLGDFFIDYGKQDRAPGEFIEAVSFPRAPDRLKCYKLSKRFDQDISAVCGCLRIEITDGTVSKARLVYGGMAGVPKRAMTAERMLETKPWALETVQTAMAAMADDFTPLSDMRASAAYRLQTSQNMLLRYWHEDLGATAQVGEARP